MSFENVDLTDDLYDARLNGDDEAQLIDFDRTSRSKWNNISNHGTILNDPMFKSDFNVEYRIWSYYKKSCAKAKNPLSVLLSSSPKMSTAAAAEKKPDEGLLSSSERQRLVDSSNPHFEDSSADDFENLGKRGSSFSVYKGIFYSSLSSLFFSLSAVIVKYLQNIHPGELAICRFFGVFAFSIPIIIFNDLNPFGPRELRHILVLRGLAGATSLFFRFCAFHYLSIADASVITFSIPIFVSIFAWLFLKEPCSLVQSFTIVIAIIGLMMTTKVPFLFGDASLGYANNYFTYSQVPSNVSAVKYYQNATTTLLNQSISPQIQRMNHFYGIASAFSSLIFSSAVFIFIRKAKGAHFAVILFNFGWIAIIETTLLTAMLSGFSLPRDHFQWYLMVILAILSFCGQVLLTRSLQLELAGPVSIVRATADIALSFVWQLIIFRETPDVWSITGALLVSSCMLLTGIRKWYLTLPEHSQLKDRFRFLSL